MENNNKLKINNKEVLEFLKEIQKEELDISEWKEYKLVDLFEIEIAKSIDKTKLKNQYNGINYISRKTTNNGLELKTNYDNYDLLNFGNTLSLTMVGEYKGTCFYQEKDFYSSQNILLLRKDNLNKNQFLFLTSLFTKKYKNENNYSDALKKQSILKETIKLPSILNQETNLYEPDWQYMENYITNLEKDLNIQKINNTIGNIKNIKKEELDISEWKEYKLVDLFDIKRGNNSKNPKTIGNIPFISSTSFNNGINNYVELNLKDIIDSNVITVANNGSVGETFYQNKVFMVSSDVSILKSKYQLFNKNIAIFLIPIIKKISIKYNYASKWSLEKMKQETIKLPSKLNQETNVYEPDWQYMEDYIIDLEKKLNN